MNRKIAVLLKIYKGDLNPFDECALECALSLTNRDITVLAMAPLAFKEKLESLTRLGVKAVLISDPLYAGELPGRQRTRRELAHRTAGYRRERPFPLYLYRC